jgi:hypothetical protein
MRVTRDGFNRLPEAEVVPEHGGVARGLAQRPELCAFKAFVARHRDTVRRAAAAGQKRVVAPDDEGVAHTDRAAS